MRDETMRGQVTPAGPAMPQATESLLEKALEVALKAHRGQRDKAGQPYILHPLRVMHAVAGEEARAVALLHDVVEDTGVTADDLRRAGFPPAVVEAVEALTKQEGEEYAAFIERVRLVPLARQVKLADLEDNLDARRLPDFSEKDGKRTAKYVRAWHRLKQA